MSKYNLTDIFEQYQIGSGFTRDFDYKGMLNTGLGTSIDTPIEVLKKISDDFEDVNYHRENNHLQGAIDALEAGDVFEANGKLNDFRHEIKNTMATLDMDMSDDLGAYMASKMDLDEGDAVDLAIEASQEKAGIKENKDKMNEVRIDREVAGRIEGLLNIPMKQKFLDAGMDLIQDLLEDEPFFISDVIEHLATELEKYYDGFLDQGDRLADMGGIEQEEFTAIDEEDSIEEGNEVDFIRALKVDANGTSLEIKSYLESLKRSGDKFDSVDDYVEDFKNYVADKALQEHFKRFK